MHDEDGILTGKVGGEMMYSDAKGDMMQRIQSLLGVSQDDTIAVGDGANDLSMFKYASTKIAFCAKDVLKEASTHTIDTKDLSLVLNIVDSL